MVPITIPLITDFKKEYKFLWCIFGNAIMNQGINLSYFKTNNDTYKESLAIYNATLNNILYCGYVSQMCEVFNIPDDEFDVEILPQGPVEYKMPKKVKLHDFTVTYLDDSLNTVYNFHKNWFKAIRCVKGTGMISPSLLAASAVYIEYENTLTASEYILLENTVMQNMQNGLQSISTYMPNIEFGDKPTNITTYPQIYPVKINRTPANHSGENLAKVTVTYTRIPQYYVNHSAYQTLNANGMWEDLG